MEKAVYCSEGDEIGKDRKSGVEPCIAGPARRLVTSTSTGEYTPLLDKYGILVGLMMSDGRFNLRVQMNKGAKATAVARAALEAVAGSIFIGRGDTVCKHSVCF